MLFYHLQLKVMLWSIEAEGLKTRERCNLTCVLLMILDMLFLEVATIIWFVTVHSGLVCLQWEQPAGRIMMLEAATVTPLCYRQSVRPCFLSSFVILKHARRHLVSATILYLWRNESDHMPVFSCSCRVGSKKKKKKLVLLLPFIAREDEWNQQFSNLEVLLC